MLLVPLAVSVGSSGFVFWLLPGLLRLSRRLASLAIAKQKRRRWPSEAQGGNQIPPFSGDGVGLPGFGFWVDLKLKRQHVRKPSSATEL